MKGNTPDFILEHFITFCFNVTAITPAWRSWNLTVMAIQHYHTQGCSQLSTTEYKLGKNPAINYNDQLTVCHFTVCRSYIDITASTIIYNE